MYPNNLKVSLLTIGNEILQGKIQDRNTQYLASSLLKKGIILNKVMVIGDSIPEISSGISDLFRDSDIVLTSGGLGPTKDDLTRSGLASFLSVGMVYSESTFEYVKKVYEKFGKSNVDQNHPYCFLPEGCYALTNEKGLAPGVGYSEKNKHIFLLPGVPREFNQMLETSVIEKLESFFPHVFRPIENFIIRTHSIPEEKIFFELDPALWNKLNKIGPVSSLPTTTGVDIHITLKKNSSEDVERLSSIVDHSPLKTHVWHIGEESPEKILFELCKKHSLSLSTVESCTSGLFASKICDYPGASKYFAGSLVSYQSSTKIGKLGLESGIIEKYGMVSGEVSSAMAKKGLLFFGTDICISTTGLFGPEGDPLFPNTSIGTFYTSISILQKDNSVSEFTFKHHLRGDRAIRKIRGTSLAFIRAIEVLKSFSF